MTKYILHGGAAKRDTEDNKKFFKEITKGLADPARILIVCFARNEAEWNDLFENTKLKFTAASPEKNMEFSFPF